MANENNNIICLDLVKEEPNDNDSYTNASYQYESCGSADMKPKRKRQHKKDIQEKKILASLVRKQPLLYNKRTNMRTSSSVAEVDAAWLDVANQMPEGTTVAQCKKWWKSLQDAVRYREKIKCLHRFTEDEDDSDWIYKDDVDFLQERTAKSIQSAHIKKLAKLKDPLEKRRTPSTVSTNIQNSEKPLNIAHEAIDLAETNTCTNDSIHSNMPEPKEIIAPSTNMYKERMQLLAKNVCLKLQNITDLKQCLLAEKLINDTLFYAEMGELTMFHSIVKTSQTRLSNN